MESRGGVYKEGTKDLAENKTSHARGPFQIKPETFEGIKERNKVDLDYNDAYDNLDACIYLLKYIHERRSKEVASGKTLPTGEDFDNALAWSYHDGAYAKKVGSAGKKYVKNFASLNILRDYPEVVDYLFNQTLLQ